MRPARLEIEDFGLIARASLGFAEGFTAISGETGSGKTMLLGALAFVLGERSSPESVRGGAERARVTLEVEVDEILRARFAADGFELDPDEPAIFVREMSASGKSGARINGRAATSAQLRAYGELLVDRVGQHEQQRLLSASYQRELLDRFAGEAAAQRRSALAVAFELAGNLERERAALDERAGRALAEFEFARFAANEIEAAAVTPGEDDALRERRDYLANVERIAAALAAAQEALGGEGAALEALGTAAAALASVARYGVGLEALSSALATAQDEANETAVAISRELDRTEFDPAELEAIGSRLDALERLKKKYGGSLEAVLAARTDFGATLEAYATRDERRESLDASLATARRDLAEGAGALSALRRAAALELETRVARELAGLAMPAARFAVTLEPLAAVGAQGAERIEFVLSPNPGEPLRALAKAASGGELSRVLLALVVVLADRRERTTLVFDEIDTGVGGTTANAVGVRLGALARAGSVVCVTHLAQIASWADRHYTLRKREARGGTSIELVELGDQPAVLEELARMLSGSSAGVALEHARTLLADVRHRKAAPKLSA
ncbi:MAG TPA: DNA repair protein RecN [Candidatus Baltobacteraceae bacterium]|nr:DNA repair protein RecN [Candidatus Baltobacteraceae bacterium]